MDPGPDTPRDDDDNNDGVATNSKELSKLVAVGAAPAPETEEEFPGHPDIAPSVTKSFNIRRSFENMDMLTGGQKNAGGGSSHFFDAINNARLAFNHDMNFALKLEQVLHQKAIVEETKILLYLHNLNLAPASRFEFYPWRTQRRLPLVVEFIVRLNLTA